MPSKKRLKHQREKKCKVCKDRKRKYKVEKEKSVDSELLNFRYKPSLIKRKS